MTKLIIHNSEDLIISSEAYQVRFFFLSFIVSMYLVILQIGVYSPGGLYLPHYDAFAPLDVSLILCGVTTVIINY